MPNVGPDITITDDEDARRYEAHVGGELAGIVTYRRQPQRMTFLHTEVAPAFEGKGVGSALARHVLDEARATGSSVRPLCPFIASYIESHSSYQDLVANREP